MKIMEGIGQITKWLRWASRQPLHGNRAADAALLIEATDNEASALRKMVQIRDDELQRCYAIIARDRGLLRDIHADLSQSARRSGLPSEWNSSELRAKTIDKLTALYGSIGRGKGSDNGN